MTKALFAALLLAALSAGCAGLDMSAPAPMSEQQMCEQQRGGGGVWVAAARACIRGGGGG